MPKKLLSFVVPTYNYGDRLERAVTSVAAQAGNDFEIVVVDDGSNDSTEEVIKSLLLRWPAKLRVYRQANKGAAVARNFGIKESDGKYVVFLDADDEMLPDAIENIRQAIELSPGVNFFLGGYFSIDELGNSRQRKPGKLSNINEINFANYLNKKILISHGSFVVKQELIDRVDYPENLKSGEDIPFFAHLFLLGNVSEIKAFLVRVFKHSNSLRHNVQHGNEAGLDLVDNLFDPNIVPLKLMAHKRKYSAQRCLSLSRSNFVAGEHELSRTWFLRAVKFNPIVLFDFGYVKNFVRSFFKT